MPAVRKITRTKFVFAESNTEAKLTPESLVKARQYNMSDVFNADVLNSPKPRLQYARPRTLITAKKRMLPRN